MPSAVGAESPHLAVVEKNSSKSIQIDREVTVVTSFARGSNQRARMPFSPDRYGRAEISKEPHAAATPVPPDTYHQRAQSMKHSVTAQFSKEPNDHQRAQSMKHSVTAQFSKEPNAAATPVPTDTYHQRAQSMKHSVSNKDSIRDLAEFLTRSEPPPSNFMSRPDSDADSNRSTVTSAFKIFGRQKSKKGRSPKLLKLPDSAVAARTMKGARYIAISIPVEYDHPNIDPPPQSSALPRRDSPRKRPGERGPITVLKPVAGVVNPVPATTNKSHVPASPFIISRQESARTDPMHSGGTAHSTAAIGSYPPPSRLSNIASSVPSATTTSTLTRGLLSRKWSTKRSPPRAQVESSKACLANKPPTKDDQSISYLPSLKSRFSTLDSKTSEKSSVYPPSTASGKSETTKKKLGGSTALKFPHPADQDPSKPLPELPDIACAPRVLASPSPSTRNKNPETILISHDAVSKQKMTHSAKSNIEDPRQSRQDSVRARKRRDMDIHKDRSAGHGKEPLAESTTSPTSQILVASPLSSEKPVPNTISEIMVVADLPPCAGAEKLEDPPAVHLVECAIQKRAMGSYPNGHVSAQGTPTPPSTAGSESDPWSPNRGPGRSRWSGKNSPLDAIRRERKVKRNKVLREREMSVRVAILERDNAIFKGTLAGIAKSFGDLNRVLAPTGVCLRQVGMLTDAGREARYGGDGKLALSESETV